MTPLIVANWKANKTIKEAVDFAGVFGSAVEHLEVNAIVCGSFLTLPTLSALTEQYSFKVGAQDVSRFNEGAYTGEITAKMLTESVTHCLVGHSERRRYFGETDQIVIEKVHRLLEHEITPILCVSDLQQLNTYLSTEGKLQEAVEKIIFVYEPPEAISGGGSYHPQSPEEAETAAKSIKDKVGRSVVVLYGGSVNPDNIASFVHQPNISGALVGQASLDPQTFARLINAANS